MSRSHRSIMELPAEYQAVTSEEDAKLQSNLSVGVSVARKCYLHLHLLPFLIIAILVFFILLYPFEALKSRQAMLNTSSAICNIQIVETLPASLRYSLLDTANVQLSSYDAWKMLLANARKSIDITSFYWNLQGTQDDPVNRSNIHVQGEHIYESLRQRSKQIKLRIVQGVPPQSEVNALHRDDIAEVVSISKSKYFGSGVLHMNLWIVDKVHFYLGSANMDWRSLTNVKELGVLVQNCPVLAIDITKIFDIYWQLGRSPYNGIPNVQAPENRANFNAKNPLYIKFNQNYSMKTYIASSPASLNAKGRAHTLDAILETINAAVSFVYIAVMDYIPMIITYRNPEYWPIIDVALRKAIIERKLTVKLLISRWFYTHPSEDYFLRSLQDITHSFEDVDLQIRRFVFPSEPDQSVNRNKYMVTDSAAYIGTSDWTGDYFNDFAGIGLVLNELVPPTQTSDTLRTQLLSIFERDWYCSYAFNFN